MTVDNDLDQDLLTALGARLRALRRDRGLSQEHLSEMLDMEPTSLSRVENGRRGLSLQRLFRASKLLKVSLSTLLDVDVPLPEPVRGLGGSGAGPGVASSGR